MGSFTLVKGVLASACATAALLGSANAQPSPAAHDCELHLYAMKLGSPPSARGNLLVKPLPASSDPLAFINVMSPYERMNDLSDEDYRSALKLPTTTRVIRHWDTRIDNGIRKTQAPLAAPRATCNAELIGYYSMGMHYKRSQTGKNEVVISLLYREFDPSARITFKFDRSGYAAIKPAEKAADRTAALSDLRNGSKEILADFAKDLAKRRAKLARKS